MNGTLKRVFHYGLLSLLGIGCYLLSSFLVWQITGTSYNLPALVATLFILLFMYEPVGDILEESEVEPAPQPNAINYKQFLKHFSTALLTVVDLNKLCELIVKTLYDFCELRSASILLHSDSKDLLILAYATGEQPHITSIKESHPIVGYLEEHQTVVNTQRMRRDFPDETVTAILDDLLCEMCIPLIFKDKLIGILTLGAKTSGESYTPEDEEAFLTLESQISIAINNALLFKVQKESQVLLAQKNKMDAIIALSSGINHEINNPLSIISMRCQNFLRKLASGKFITASEVVQNAQEVIESSLRNANRAHMITKRLANFAQPAGKKMNFQPLSIKDSIVECIDLIGKKQFFGDNITLNIDIPDNLPDIYADKVHFQQVLYNIIMNAYHAVEQNGTITFRAFEKGRTKIVVEIHDTGIGIPHENVEKIWEPFYTTKPTNPLPGQKATGSGLGLSLVKRYIESSGGSVSVTSAPQMGTTFSLTLVKVTKENGNE